MPFAPVIPKELVRCQNHDVKVLMLRDKILQYALELDDSLPETVVVLALAEVLAVTMANKHRREGDGKLVDQLDSFLRYVEKLYVRYRSDPEALPIVEAVEKMGRG